jgi:hypothetical protein
MGDLKPIGSEKLNGDAKMKRILELTYYKQNTIKENTKSVHAELIKETKNGVYGIVREKDAYYVKRGLNEASLDYIGGLFMKNKNKFSSYAEALKRLELINSQELNEDVTKYVLKQNKPKSEEPQPMPSMPEDLPAPAPEMGGASSEMPAPEMGDSTPDMGEPSTDDMSSGQSDTSKRSDYMAEIQKFAGKLGQELRDQQPKMESDDIKYVLNMIISAVDLDILDEEDIEDIAKKFERDEEAMDEPGMDEPMPEDDPEVPVDAEADSGVEDDLAERISKLEELINSKFEEPKEQDLGEYEDVNEFYFNDDDFEDSSSDMPDEKSLRSNFHASKQIERPSRLMKSMKTNSAWFDDNEKQHSEDQFNLDDYDEEDFDDYDNFMAKHGDTSLDLRDKKFFGNYTPLKVKTLRKNNDLDITPELDDINESINNTLSKYFE